MPSAAAWVSCEAKTFPEQFVHDWILNQGLQLVWGQVTNPGRIVAANMIYRFNGKLINGNHIPQRLWHKTNLDVTKWGIRGPKGNSQYTVMNYGKSGYKVTGSNGAGSIKVNNPKWQWARGNRGALGSIVGAGLIDGIAQVFGDLIVGNLCLSPHQFFWRGMVALGFGLVGGAIGLGVGALVLAAGGTGAILGLSVAGLAGWGASLAFAAGTSGAKDDTLNWVTRKMDW